MRKAKAKAAVRAYVDSLKGEPQVVETTVEVLVKEPPESILSRLCSVSEYVERTHSYQMKVLRDIERGDLQAKKVGKTWVILD